MTTTTTHQHPTHDDHVHAHHGPKNPDRAMLLTLIALLFLTFVTVGASYINFGSSTINVIIAMAIASTKASLVALIFMHLRWDKPVNGIIAVGGFLFLGIFLLFSWLDVYSRVPYEPVNVKPGPTMPAPVTTNPGAAPNATPAPPAH
jgi:cytochrome c oxidase subunit 4